MDAMETLVLEPMHAEPLVPAAPCPSNPETEDKILKKRTLRLGEVQSDSSDDGAEPNPANVPQQETPTPAPAVAKAPDSCDSSGTGDANHSKPADEPTKDEKLKADESLGDANHNKPADESTKDENLKADEYLGHAIQDKPADEPTKDQNLKPDEPVGDGSHDEQAHQPTKDENHKPTDGPTKSGHEQAFDPDACQDIC